MQAIVAIIMGSDSDLAIMQETAKTLESFNIGYSIDVISAHRTPDIAAEFASNAHKKGIRVIIAAAGLAAHLAGAMAAHSPLPVIGVPIAGGTLGGIDAALSTLQMPPGVPVATVGINGAKNAALLAVQILATSNEHLLLKYIEYKKSEGQKVVEKSKKLQEIGYKGYLEKK
jgi:5-(carboxyamino)imidazole ribonucleotide mutase